jgi:hypothetical protein
MFREMIIACHKYFKEEEEASSISLRDVQRFIILSNFFKEQLEKKVKLAKTEGFS